MLILAAVTDQGMPGCSPILQPKGMLCPRLRIWETTKEPTRMQTHEGLFTTSSLDPSVPDTAEQGLGPRGGFQLTFKDWSRGPPEGVEQFLKFCLHFDMGPSRALSSVLILIGASCPRPGLSSYANVGLSKTLSCKLLVFCCNWSNGNFSSSLQGRGMAGRVLTLDLKWNGLNFLGLHASRLPI